MSNSNVPPISGTDVIAEQTKLRGDIFKNTNTCNSLENALTSILHTALSRHENDIESDNESITDSLDMDRTMLAEDIPGVNKLISLISKGKVKVDNQMLEDLQKLDKMVKDTKQELSKLADNLVTLDSAVKELSKFVKETKQYIQSENLLFHNFYQPQSKSLSSLQYSCFMANQINHFLGPHLPVPVSPLHISTAHRYRTKLNKSNVIIVRFAHRHMKEAIFARKHLLEGMNMSITEHLIPEKLATLKRARQLFGYKNADTDNCKVFVTINGVYKFVDNIEQVNELFEASITTTGDSLTRPASYANAAHDPSSNIRYSNKNSHQRHGYSVRNRAY